MIMNCAGYAGYTYLMQVATNLTPPVMWQTVSTNVADTNGAWQFTDTSAGSHPARFIVWQRQGFTPTTILKETHRLSRVICV
jgi:hypothetical protein